MKIITKRRVNKAADEIIDAVLDNADFDVDVMGPGDYDVTMFVNKWDKDKMADLLYRILTDKKPRKRWQLLNTSVRKAK